MPGTLLEQPRLTAKFLQRLGSRDAVLWVGTGFADTPEVIAALWRIIGLPWKLVLLESTSAPLASLIAQKGDADPNLVRLRGYPHIVAFDPINLQLPEHSLPVYLLNGRDGGVAEESSALSIRAATRRRLNQIARMVAARPAEVTLLGFGNANPLEEFREVWREELRTLVSIVSASPTDRAGVEEWLKADSCPNALDFYPFDVESFASALNESFLRVLSSDRILIHVRNDQAEPVEQDITGCELAEQPILDRYELIQIPDLVPLQAHELTLSDLEGFFDRSVTSWRPYAAGIPWLPNKKPFEDSLRALERVERTGPDENKLLVVASESGAGGTTLARAIAYHCACAGFPALVARPVSFRPSVTEVESFLHRVRRSYEATLGNETPWLIVFDAAHWAGQESELRHFTSHLTRRGRSVVVLAVTSEQLNDQLINAMRGDPIAFLRHEIEQEDALALGEHLNRFLTPLGRTKTKAEWTSFWEANRPGLDTPIASFWIALEFWLKGSLNLGDSIQQWLFRQFQGLEISDEFRTILLEIAALTVERHPFPEQLMPAAGRLDRPYSVLLEDARSDAPGLGLVRERAGGQRRWALAHTQLGRYLLVSTYFDRQLCNRLGFQSATNPSHLRLLLLRRTIGRAELARGEFRQLALDFAVRIFKLDPGYADEFFPLWREVFHTLNDVNTTVRNTSRTFLHHIAISCRRVAIDTSHFDATNDEREALLRSAIKHLEFALTLPATEDEESNLNLYNSLARAYQNLAEVRRLAGAPEAEITALRERATKTTLRAQEEDPLNPYVLETTAENLLQGASIDPASHVRDTLLALNYINEALLRDHSDTRKAKLHRLLMRAIDLLRKTDARKALARLQESNQSIGFVAQAWLELTEDSQTDSLSFQIAEGRARRALEILDHVKAPSDWLVLKLRYDLIAVVRPYVFEEQLTILEELDGTAFQMPLQYQLEHAVLLYQVGRHPDGSRRFKFLRKALRERDAYVDVPARMRWLFKRGSTERQTCDARVSDTSGFKRRAKVKDLANEPVPFTPQDFGQREIHVGYSMKVTITFGAMGPFAKPPANR